MILINHIWKFLFQFVKNDDYNPVYISKSRFNYSPKPFIKTLTVNSKDASLFGISIGNLSKVTLDDFLAQSKLADYPMRVDRENDY